MADQRPTPDAVSAASALSLALRELDRAVDESELVANRAGAAVLTLTVSPPTGLPLVFLLAPDEKAAAIELLPRISAARIAAARAKVRDLTDRVNSGSGAA